MLKFQILENFDRKKIPENFDFLKNQDFFENLENFRKFSMEILCEISRFLKMFENFRDFRKNRNFIKSGIFNIF